MNATYPSKLVEVLEPFDETIDRELRSEILVDFAKRFVEVPPKIAQRPFPDVNRVPACESRAFVFVQKRPDGAIEPFFAVDNPQGISAQSFAAILQETLSGESAETIKEVDEKIVLKIFRKCLSR